MRLLPHGYGSGLMIIEVKQGLAVLVIGWVTVHTNPNSITFICEDWIIKMVVSALVLMV